MKGIQANSPSLFFTAHFSKSFWIARHPCQSLLLDVWHSTNELYTSLHPPTPLPIPLWTEAVHDSSVERMVVVWAGCFFDCFACVNVSDAFLQQMDNTYIFCIYFVSIFILYIVFVEMLNVQSSMIIRKGKKMGN